MKRTNAIIIILFISTLLTSCYSSKVSVSSIIDNSEEYDRGDSISNVLVIMPPINKTHHVKAKEYFYATLPKPLSEKGFYVLPSLLTLDFLRNESGYDSERFLNADLGKFKSYLGAEVALFTIIHQWEKLAMLGSVVVKVEYILKDTSTNKVLFRKVVEAKADGSIDLTSNSNTGASEQTSLAEDAVLALVSLSITSINSAQIKHHKIARSCNDELMKYFPDGNYRRGSSQTSADSSERDTVIID